MRKNVLRILLIFFGLSAFTSCYGTPPGDWDEPALHIEEQDQTKASVQSDEDPNLEEQPRNGNVV